MERKEFREELFRIALERGCSAAETYYYAEESFETDVLNGELSRYSVSNKQGLNLRVRCAERDGYAYTEILEDAEQLVLRAMDNAKSIEDTDDTPLCGPQKYETVEQKTTVFDTMSDREKIDLALRLEQKTLEADPRIVRVAGCAVQTSNVCRELHNTLGLAAVRETSEAAVYVSAVAREGERVKDGFAARLNAEACDIEAIALESAKDATFQLDAEPVETGIYAVVFRHNALASLLGQLLPMFSAEEAQKGKSRLADKAGETIAASCITIVDDPFHPSAPRAFDGEGMPTKRTVLVENGVFRTLLYDRKTARKAGTETTGNAVRSASGPVRVGPTVFCIEPGETSFDGLLDAMQNGLMIDSLGGLHVGVDSVSGDFSLMAGGAVVENGKIVRAADRITVAGNFFTMLKEIALVGSDSKCSVFSPIVCPSILVNGLQIAGK